MSTFFLFLCLLIASLAIFFHYNEKGRVTPKPSVPQEEIQISQEQKDFNALFARVQKLEELSKQYDATDYKLRALIYLRSCKYNDSQWNLLGGSVDQTFIEYVKQNEGANQEVSSFRPLNEGTAEQTLTDIYFVVPSLKTQVDFYHMFAVMNIVYEDGQTTSDLSGWGGDLVQFVNSIKNYSVEYSSLNGAELSYEELKTKVQQEFNNSAEFGFGSADVAADFDAVNIAKNITSSSIYSAITSYYKNLTEAKRIQQFRTNTFTEEYYSAEELNQVIFTRLNTNMYIRLLVSQYGLKFDVDVIIFDTCIQVFAEYLLSV